VRGFSKLISGSTAPTITNQPTPDPTIDFTQFLQMESAISFVPKKNVKEQLFNKKGKDKTKRLR
jgi:hypothetical protein